MEERRQLWALLEIADALKGSIRHYRISERHQAPMQPRQDMQSSGYTPDDVMDGFDNRARLHLQLALVPAARFITDHLYSAQAMPTLRDVDVAHQKLAEVEEVIMVSFFNHVRWSLLYLTCLVQNKPNFDIPEDFDSHTYPKLPVQASFALVNRVHYSMELRALMARLHRPL